MCVSKQSVFAKELQLQNSNDNCSKNLMENNVWTDAYFGWPDNGDQKRNINFLSTHIKLNDEATAQPSQWITCCRVSCHKIITAIAMEI